MANIQGQPLEVTVIGCTGLRDTEWLMRQDPYVCIEYGSTKYRTRTCSDGGKRPTFQEKFVFPMIQGLSEMNVVVWNSNTLSADDFIGSGKVQLSRTITQGYDDTPWPLCTRSGKHAGEVRIIMRYANNGGMAPSAYGYGFPTAYPAPAPPNHPTGYGVYPPPSGYPQPVAYPPPGYWQHSYGGHHPPPYY